MEEKGDKRGEKSRRRGGYIQRFSSYIWSRPRSCEIPSPPLFALSPLRYCFSSSHCRRCPLAYRLPSPNPLRRSPPSSSLCLLSPPPSPLSPPFALSLHSSPRSQRRAGVHPKCLEWRQGIG